MDMFFRSLLRPVATALLAAALLAPVPASAGSAPAATESATRDPAERETVIAQSGDCYAIGERVAAQNGGTLARATASTQGGQSVCIIVVLVPAKDGQRPRRTEIVVPQN